VTDLHVGVNLLWLVPGVVGGTEEYTTRLLGGIATAPPEGMRFTLFVLDPFARAHPDLAAAFDTVVAPLDGTKKAMRVAFESSWLTAKSRRLGIDLVHHAGGTMPPVRGAPGILTIHDLQPLLEPRNFHPVKQRYLRARVGPSARRARLVTALSEHGRRTIVELLDVDPDRVVVVPPGYDVGAMVSAPDGDPAQRHGIRRPFFLYPAISYPHKNHLTLVRAFAVVARERPDVQLVLTGGAAGAESGLADEIRDLGLSERVRRLGRVPRGDLDWLLQHAAALTFPSRFEGFGLPVLEAMGNGCPVIAAATTALPEVVDGAGLLVDPDDVHEWSRSMMKLLDDRQARDHLVSAGRRRATEFGWAESSARLVAAYRRAQP
jgi:glycosyltransferase involved in cell wall biosynthesis